jgi:8-oxoguanine DNA-glycosylase Ogg
VKIERSVKLLAQRYGKQLFVPDSDGCASDLLHYRFPTVEELAAADEQVLRADLWGYRAPRVIDLATRLMAMGNGWLENLREASYEESHAQLAALPGVGPKVADCICLFALDKDQAVPIDTHTRQIAVRLFEQNLAAKSLTARVYTILADSYRSRFGEYAGWAQQYLFFAELRRSGQYATAIHRHGSQPTT